MKTAVVYSAAFAVWHCLSFASELKVNQPVEGALAAGATDSYEVALQAGQYAGIEVEQIGLSVYATVTDPNGAAKDPVFGFPPRVPFGVGILAGQLAGVYKVAIKSVTPGASGAYRIRLIEVVPEAERLVPSGDPRYRSPRLERLFSSNPASLDAFWEEVKQAGTPLIERYGLDPKFYLVTFLYRGTAATNGALVLWYPHVRSDYINCLMQRWGTTDLWYRTFLVPAASRFVYSLQENPGPAPLFLGPRASRAIDEARWSTIARPVDDPFNKLPVDDQHAVELPGAPPQPYQAERPDAPKGKLEALEYQSGILKNKRELKVYTPPGYSSSGRRYPLLIVMDGPVYTSSIPTPRLLDNLLQAGKISPLVAVFVPNVSGEMRYRELGCSESFSSALEKELIPLVAGKYHVSIKQKDTGIAGSSRAGLMAVCAALHRPLVFGNVIAQSPLLWYDPSVDYFLDDLNRFKRDPEVPPNWAAGEIVNRPRLPIRFHLDAGRFEVNTGHPGNGAILESTRHFRDVLRAKGYFVHYQEFNGGHEYFNWRGTLADGIAALYSSGK